MTQSRNLTNSKVLQSSFDKAFVQIVEFLYSNWQLHRKFRFKSELFLQFNWKGNQYANIKSGKVNVPKHLVAKISAVLIREYGVSPIFLSTATGPMFSENANEWLSKAPDEVFGATSENIDFLQKQIIALKTRIRNLQSENERLKAQLEDKKSQR
ncbi:MAG TPA: hypothetical protein DIW54_10110 [Chitinophagaceae bacterium]|nr:hypothetical protein [Chitinophagaceae bacterium]HCT23655.1 hypothetical protein [Chitinophagaceae bacterium]